MFLKYVDVSFIGAADAPKDVYSADMYYNRFEHQIFVIKFRDWGMSYDSVEPGTPVIITYGFNNKSTFYGYVHHLSANRTVNNSFMEITFIGSSFLMKQASQKVYRDTTADQVVEEIARKYNFAVYAVPHPRVWPQLTQAGDTDWAFLVKLAKKCGYSLRTNNTELYFQPMLEEYTNYRTSAPKYVLRGPGQAFGWTMYSFTPLIGDSIPYEDSFKGAVAVAGVDSINSAPMNITHQSRNAKTRRINKPEMFDRFATDVVVSDQETAAFEAKAAEDRNAFPYRAEAVLMGDASLRPDMPIFLDGIGAPYSGYWTVLGVHHVFEEKERGSHVHTTKVVVGTDSLGTASRWIDGTEVVAPTSNARVLNPKLRQTTKPVVTSLSSAAYRLPKQVRSSLNSTQNRAAPTGKVANKAPTWKASSSSLVKQDKKSSTPYHVVSRLQKRGML